MGGVTLTYVSVTAAVNKWGAPNKKRESSSSVALARIVERDKTSPMRIFEKQCPPPKREDKATSRARSRCRRPGKVWGT